MQLQIDVYDAAGQKIGEGPIRTATRASVTRLLDGAGSFQFSVPAHDERAIELLQNERRVRIHVDEGEALREIGRGIIRQSNYRAGDGGWELQLSGPDMLDELKRRSTNTNRAYADMPVREIVADLIGLVPGWSAECDIETRYSGRFDAVSVLKAVQTLVEKFGLHLRMKLGVEGNILQVGAFGEDAGLRLINPSRIPAGGMSDQVGMLQSFDVVSESDAVANRLFPLGAGQNVDAALTLEKATRHDPPVLRRERNGRTIFYLEDPASIERYGVIEKDGQFKDVAALENSETFEGFAADALHDAATAWLRQYAYPQTTYSAQVRGVQQTLSQGDRVTVDYIDTVEDAGRVIPIKKIQGDMWLMRVAENIGPDGVSLSMTLSDIDRYQESASRTMIGALDQISLQETVIQPSFNHSPFGPEQAFVNPSTPGRVELIVTDKVHQIIQVTMRVRTQPFVATASGAAAGGDHYHEFARYNGDYPLFRPEIVYEVRTNGGGFVYMALKGPDSSLVTRESSGDHTHAMVYGLHRDTQRPAGMTITCNGRPVAAGVGSVDADFDETYDITEQVLARSGGWRGVHNVGVTAASGQGEVLVTFDVYALIMPFRKDA